MLNFYHFCNEMPCCLWIASQPFPSLAFPYQLAALAHDNSSAQLFITQFL